MLQSAGDLTLMGFLSTTIFGVAIGLGFSIGSALYELVGSLFHKRPQVTK